MTRVQAIRHAVERECRAYEMAAFAGSQSTALVAARRLHYRLRQLAEAQAAETSPTGESPV